MSNIVDLENNHDMRIVGVRAVDANGVPPNYTYRYIAQFSANFSVTIDL